MGSFYCRPRHRRWCHDAPSRPSQADNTITEADQPYFAYYHLDSGQGKGYTGKAYTALMMGLLRRQQQNHGRVN